MWVCSPPMGRWFDESYWFSPRGLVSATNKTDWNIVMNNSGINKKFVKLIFLIFHRKFFLFHYFYNTSTIWHLNPHTCEIFHIFVIVSYKISALYFQLLCWLQNHISIWYSVGPLWTSWPTTVINKVHLKTIIYV